MTNCPTPSTAHLWNTAVKDLTPYLPGEQPVDDSIVKLNTNENPYPPAPRVIEELRKGINADLRLYPDPQAFKLKEDLAAFHSVDIDRIFLGNGSNEVLALLFLALFQRSRPLLVPDITYSFYRVLCRLFGQPFKKVALKRDLEIVPADYFGDNGGVLLANPNSPTGRLLSLEQIRAIARQNPGSVVVVDEAYVDFGGESAIGLLDRHPNIVVVRTFSKSRSLAGIRVGYAMAVPHLIKALERVKNSFNPYPLDRLAIAAAAASVKDREYFESTCLKIVRTRQQTVERLQEAGFEVLPSQANFILVTHPVVSGANIAAYLKEKGIWVRRFPDSRIENRVRISIGTASQMTRCVDEMEKLTALS